MTEAAGGSAALFTGTMTVKTGELAGGGTDYTALAMHMREDAGTEYMGKAVELDVALRARQTAEGAEYPEDITLNVQSVALSVNGTYRLTVQPEGSAVTWRSSDASVATVSEDGVITAQGAGSALITASNVFGRATVSVAVTEAEGVSGGAAVTLDEEGGIQSIAADGTAVVIPAQVNGQTVTGTVSKSLITDAAGGSLAEEMTYLYIPAGVDIAEEGFSGCTSLQTVEFAEDSDITEIPFAAFMDCTSLTGISLPDSVTEIGLSAFRGSGLQQIGLPSGITSLPYGVFYNCADLKSVVLPSELETIGQDVFNGAGIETITIPRTVTEIEERAFSNTPNLSAIIFEGTAADAGISFGGQMFEGSALEEIELPANTAEISATFTRLFDAPGDSIKRVTFAEGCTLERIAYNAFQGSRYLEYIEIPASVTVIGGQAFSGCTNLSEVVFEENSSLKEISDHAFYGCTSLKTITIPKSVEVIGGGSGSLLGAFPQSGLETVLFEEGSMLTTIGWSAFRDCTSLKTVVIPASVQEMATLAFGRCSAGLNIYYLGTESGWTELIANSNSSAFENTDTTVYYFSETNVDGAWHYVDGVPTLW